MTESEINSLLMSIKSGKSEAFSELCVKFSPLLESLCGACVKKYEALFLERDELKQEALIALYNAAVTYDDGKNVSFGAYAKVCINNRLISYVRKQYPKRKTKKIPQKEYITPESRVIDKENAEKLEKIVRNQLTPLEKSVFDLYIRKLPYKIIAQNLNISRKSADNAICRIKAKLRKFL